MERRRFSTKVKAEVVARFDGRCAHPGCMSTGPFEFDHLIALDLGGNDEPANLQPLCEAHHKAKTALDIKLIAKGRRIRAKAEGTFRPNRKVIRSRGFDKSHRQKFDGSVVERTGAARMG
jgi:5-methylcytosine-specific restriction endonuclease McrA